VDGTKLSDNYRALLRPAEAIADDNGHLRQLPRYFFEVPSWETAQDIKLAEHFRLAELMMVDCREADLLLRNFPHYVPCAIAVLACYLERFRHEAEAPVFVSANGGYRSPAHQLNGSHTVHVWGTAADIYRVGDTYLDDERAIGKFGEIAQLLGPQIFVRPYAQGDDHLHIDVGFISVIPRELSEIA
jgi:hypothetical protein